MDNIQLWHILLKGIIFLLEIVLKTLTGRRIVSMVKSKAKKKFVQFFGPSIRKDLLKNCSLLHNYPTLCMLLKRVNEFTVFIVQGGSLPHSTDDDHFLSFEPARQDCPIRPVVSRADFVSQFVIHHPLTCPKIASFIHLSSSGGGHTWTGFEEVFPQGPAEDPKG